MAPFLCISNSTLTIKKKLKKKKNIKASLCSEQNIPDDFWGLKGVLRRLFVGDGISW